MPPFDPFPTSLSDANGIRLGSEHTGIAGQRQLFDAECLYRGTYDPTTNLTRDAQGLIVGRGNLLASLLRDR